MLACPGWFEEFHRRPAAGDVAQTLDTLLEILRHWLPGFPVRQELTITNATSSALWEERDRRTSPTQKMIKDPANLKRLKDEIGHIEQWLICFGPKAIYAAKRLQQQGMLHHKCTVIEIQQHLAYLGIRTIKKDLDGQDIRTVKEDPKSTRKRLAVIANDILKKMGCGCFVNKDDIGPWPEDIVPQCERLEDG